MADRYKSLYNGVLGLAIGDALGVPAEFMNRTVLKRNPITEMISGGCWNQPAGTWSDDTSMTLATIDALNKSNWKNELALYDIVMNNFKDWLDNGKFAACGKRFDVGNTCEEAIQRYRKFKNTENCGLGEGKCGNGSLMRILPTMFLSDDAVLKISRLTHNNKTCDSAVLAYVHYARELANGKDKTEALSILLDVLKKNGDYESVVKRLSNGTAENRILATSYVVDTLEAAIWCLLNTDSYKECVLKAVNLGDDADTVAAVAGGLAGIYYGTYKDDESRGIPKEFIDKLRDLDTINYILEIAHEKLY